MNILQRRMFAQGDVVNAGPQPRVDIPKLIQYYVSQGYNATEIKEMIPNVSFSEIESVVSGLGGSVNPAIASPGADEFTGNINVFQEIPETKVVQRQAPKVELPKNIELDQIRKYIEATKDLGIENQILGLKVNFNLTDEEAKEYLALPETSIEMPDPSLASLDAVEITEEPLSTTGLAPNEYRTSDGRIFSIDPQKLKSLLAGENARIISGILLNPKAEYGSNLAAIVESEALGKSSTWVDPKSIKVGGVDEFTGLGDVRLGLRPGQLISETGKFAVDFAKEGIEGLVNQVRKLGGSEMVGIFRGREAAKKAKAAGRDEPLNIFETPLDSQSGFLKSLEEIKQYQLTGGETPETLDSIILEASVGEVTPDNISKQLEDLEKTSPPADTVTEDVEAEEEIATTTEETTEEVVEEKPEGAVAEDVVATTEETVTETKPEVVPAGDFQRAGNVFSNPNFVRFVANLSKGLATSEDMASGLAKGAALAAEERGLRDLEQQKFNQELQLELIDKMDAGKMDLTDAKKVYDLNNTANTAAQSFQNSTSTLALIKELENVLKSKNPTSLSSFTKDILEKAGVALGQDKTGSIEDFKKLSSTEQARKLSTLISQANIREILGESGRTISNFDRQIVQDLSTAIVIGAPAASNLLSLNEVDKRIRNNMQTQLDEINSVRYALNLAGMELTGLNAFDVIRKGISLLEATGVELDDEIIDFRDQFKK